MKAGLLFFVLILCGEGCAAASTVGQIEQETLPTVGAGLLAAEDLYNRACKPEPLPGLDKVCPEAKAKINLAVEGYTKVNNAVKDAQ